MSSDEYEYGEVEASTSLLKNKRQRESGKISVDLSQHCIASAMAKIVNRMVNKELQQRCKELLEMEDLAETEARILFILQQIDQEKEEAERTKKESKEARKAKSRKYK